MQNIYSNIRSKYIHSTIIRMDTRKKILILFTLIITSYLFSYTMPWKKWIIVHFLERESVEFCF